MARQVSRGVRAACGGTNGGEGSDAADPTEPDNFDCTSHSVASCSPGVDTDGDDSDDEDECHLGTDPLDACPDSTSDDAWPPDTKIDTKVDILDVVKFRPVILHCSGDPAYNIRYDLVINNCIDILDVVKLKPYLWLQCTNP